MNDHPNKEIRAAVDYALGRGWRLVKAGGQPSHTMKTYEFTVILAKEAEMTEDMADALFAVGCDDCTPGSRDGVVEIDFDRESDSLENAIRSAIANVQSAGYTVKRVEIYADSEVLKV